jgi:hypothetical protein
MLDLKKEDYFKYYLRQLFEDSDINEDLVPSITANLLSKAARNSIDDAIEYKNEQIEAGNIPKELSDEIERLLKKYSYWR